MTFSNTTPAKVPYAVDEGFKADIDTKFTALLVCARSTESVVYQSFYFIELAVFGFS